MMLPITSLMIYCTVHDLFLQLIRQKLDEGREAIQDDPLKVQEYRNDLHKRLADAGIDASDLNNLRLTIQTSPKNKTPRKRKDRDSPSDPGGSPSGQAPAKRTSK
jgi:hypothetical protein